MTATTNTKKPTLVIFGEEFEKFGGLRILSIANTMHDEDPVADWGYYVDSCYRYLTEEQTLAGCEKEEDLDPLIDACYTLRMEYGHGAWVAGALLDYLRAVKCVDNAVALRDRMVAEAEQQFKPLANAYHCERIREYIESLKERIPMLEKALRESEQQLTAMQEEMAQAA